MPKFLSKLLTVLAVLAALALLLTAGLHFTKKAAAAHEPAAVEAAGAPAPTAEDRARAILAGMTAEEKVWQMLIVYPQDLTGQAVLSDLEAWADAMHRCPVGGVFLDGDNMESAESLRSMMSAIASSADIRVFTCVDEEGGSVARLDYYLHAVTSFAPMYTYKELGASTAYANAYTIGSEISGFGFNVDFAPVADVWTNPDNTVIGRRAYSDDPAQAAGLVAAAVKGFGDAGVIATLKHFPGHGDTAEDSHYGAASSGKTLEELRSCELLPFLSGIEAGAQMVMVGHIVLTELDPEAPATLSKTIVTDLLRGELGFDGVVITDGFQMEGLTAYGGSEGELAVRAIEAGCDMILGPADPEAVAAALLEQLSQDRVDESVLRILMLKLESGILIP